MKHALATALIVGVTAPLAEADLMFGDPIEIVESNDDGRSWGTGVAGGGTHPFEGISLFFTDDFFSLVVVTSTELLPPPDFTGLIEITYTGGYYLEDGPQTFESIDIFGVKMPGDLNIIDTVISNVGTVTTNGFDMFFDIDIGELRTHMFGGGSIEIFWTQGEGGFPVVPLPPAVWLGSLGFVAVIVMRRKLF